MVPPLPDAVRGRPLRLFLVEVFAQGVGECRAYRPFTSIKNMVFATGLTAIRSATGVVCPDVNATSYPRLRSSGAPAKQGGRVLDHASGHQHPLLPQPLRSSEKFSK